MQAKDIPELPILKFLIDHAGGWCFNFPAEIDDRSVLHAMPKDVPGKLVIAKMNGLIRRGLVSGCTCGCRGDYEITDKGREYFKASAARIGGG